MMGYNVKRTASKKIFIDSTNDGKLYDIIRFLIKRMLPTLNLYLLFVIALKCTMSFNIMCNIMYYVKTKYLQITLIRYIVYAIERKMY